MFLTEITTTAMIYDKAKNENANRWLKNYLLSYRLH